MTDLTKPHAIIPGGGRTSESLDMAFETLFANMQLLHRDVQLTTDEVAALYARLAFQCSCYTAALGTPAVSRVAATQLLDMHVLDGITVAGSTTARWWPEYGLWTPETAGGLPSNQFCLQNLDGDVWVPRETNLEYSFDGVAWLPSTTDADYRRQVAYAFDGRASTAWSAALSSTDADIYVRATLPTAQLFDARTNAVAIHPAPEFGAQLVSCHALSGDAWVNLLDAATTSSIPATSAAALPWAGQPMLLLFAPLRIQRVLLHFKLPLGLGTTDTRKFYLSHLGAYSFAWQSSGVVDLDLTGLLGTKTIIAGSLAANSDALTAPVAQITGARTVRVSLSTRTAGVPYTLRNLTFTTGT